ncbi:MAG: DUF2442 domain-containing protein [Pseudomonadota bacterium]|nr:DUF2442 domain-containing protein [Pseudomonadota bacterium]
MDLIDNDIIEAATRRGAAKKAAFPAVVAARYDRRIARIVITLDTGLDLAFAPHLAQGFEEAKPADLDVIEISPSGLGVHFPKIDADIYVPALIEGLLGTKRWMAAENGRAGGKAATSAKAAAARENGKAGGRPKKTPAAAPNNQLEEA